MSKLNPNLFPPGGYHFVGPDHIRHEANDLPALVSKVLAYRRLNRLSEQSKEEIEKEIVEFLCKKYPHVCTSNSGGTVEQPAEKYREVHANLTNRVLAWIFKSGTEKKIPLVSQSIAEKRAAICRGCPMNREWRGTCPACNDSYNRLSIARRNGNETIDQEKLLGCDVFGHDNRTAVWTDQERSDKGPAHCWKRNLPESV